jgi:serine protease Do
MKNTNTDFLLIGLFAGLIGALLMFFFLVGVTYTGVGEAWMENFRPTFVIDDAAIDVSDVVATVNDAVVAIVITKDLPTYETVYANPFGESQFGFLVPERRQTGTELVEIGGGSGFFVRSDGYIATNAHVVSDREASYTVIMTNGTQLVAKVVAVDPLLDIAVLKVEGEDFIFLEFADSNEIRLGQAVIAIGNALAEYQNSVSTGVVSGLSRSIITSSEYGQTQLLENVIQTDAAINQGNSGGPLMSIDGKVIGVNVAMANDVENIAFALPANEVKLAVDSIVENGRVSKPYVGVLYVMVTPEVVEAFDLTSSYGAYVFSGESSVSAVIEGSPADKAGLLMGDLILSIDGRELRDSEDLPAIMSKKRVGDVLSFVVLRGIEEIQLNVVLEEIPE